MIKVDNQADKEIQKIIFLDVSTLEEIKILGAEIGVKNFSETMRLIVKYGIKALREKEELFK